jgi:hypothetical protein
VLLPRNWPDHLHRFLLPRDRHQNTYSVPIRAKTIQSRCEQADVARADFAAITDDLDCIKSQLSRQPDRRRLSRMGLMDLGSVWALLAAVALMLARGHSGRSPLLEADNAVLIATAAGLGASLLWTVETDDCRRAHVVLLAGRSVRAAV